MNNNLRLVRNLLPDVKKRFEELSDKEVLVGVPSDKSVRNEPSDVNNAMLAYVHDNGSPAQNIPARPFMKPGIELAKSDIVKLMKIGARRALTGNSEAIEDTLIAVGTKAQMSIRSIITNGIGPPLKTATLKARIKRGKGRIKKGATAELQRRSDTGEEGMDLAKPLIFSSQLLKSINFVIRKKE